MIVRDTDGYDIECVQPIDDYGRAHRKRARGEIARHFRDYDPFAIQAQTTVIENRLDLGAHRNGDVRLREGTRNPSAEKCVASEAVDFRAEIVDANFARLLRLIHLSDVTCGLLLAHVRIQLRVKIEQHDGPRAKMLALK